MASCVWRAPYVVKKKKVPCLYIPARRIQGGDRYALETGCGKERMKNESIRGRHDSRMKEADTTKDGALR